MCILAGTASDCDEMKHDRIHLARLARREEVSEAQVLSGRLPWKCKSHFLVFVVDDEIVSFRLAFVIAIDKLGDQQLFLLRTLLQLFVNREHRASHEFLVFVEWPPAL